MKKTFVDKIVLILFIIIIIVFVILAIYSTYATQRVLVKEKQNNLINEASLLASQTIKSYIDGITSLDYLHIRFDEFEDSLKTKVWFTDANGNMLAASKRNEYRSLPDNIFKLDESDTLKNSFTLTGDFYGMFDSTMISVGFPVYAKENLKGYLILHASFTELDQIRRDMVSIIYMPFLIIILFTFILIAYVSRSILRPLAKINATATEYATGNFEATTGINRNDELGELSESLEYMAGELSKLDEYRKNFIANISHDFRSPLTSIKGYLEAILDGTIPPETHEKYLKIVLSESNRLTKLTSGLLELNNFDTYGPVLKKTHFDIMQVTKEIIDTFEGTLKKKKISMIFNCLAEFPLVYADKMKIQQVVYNLVDNAIKFSPEKSVISITISEIKDKLFISVKDSGFGIDKESQKKVWVRFYKTDPSRGKDKLGTGLGLSITKEIIKAHGENINLVSTEGAGSEFIFSLTKSKA